MTSQTKGRRITSVSLSRFSRPAPSLSLSSGPAVVSLRPDRDQIETSPRHPTKSDSFTAFKKQENKKIAARDVRVQWQKRKSTLRNLATSTSTCRVSRNMIWTFTNLDYGKFLVRYRGFMRVEHELIYRSRTGTGSTSFVLLLLLLPLPGRLSPWAPQKDAAEPCPICFVVLSAMEPFYYSHSLFFLLSFML